MANPIHSLGGLGPVNPLTKLQPPQQAGQASESSFKDLLLKNLEEVNRLQTEADAGVQKLLTGETDNVAEVFAAASKAGIAFDLLMEVRNKLQDAYRDIQQMRV